MCATVMVVLWAVQLTRGIVMFPATSKLSCTKNSLSLRNGPALPKLTVCQSVVTEEGNLPSQEMPSLYYQVLLSSGLVVGLVI